MRKLKKITNYLFNKKNLIVLGSVLIFVLLIVVLQKDIFSKKTTKTQTNDIVPQTVKYLPYEKELGWVLKNKIKGETEIVWSRSCNKNCNNSFPPIVFWGNWLYYIEDGSIVKGLNLDTKEEKIIYDLDKKLTDFPKDKPSFEITNIRVINDTLFFGVGRFLDKNGILYYVNLIENSKPVNLINGYYPSIVRLNNTDFVYEGDGDACGGWGTLYRLDTKPIQVIKVSETKLGCVTGEEIIDIDERNNIITADHGFDMYEDDISQGFVIYNYIALIPANNPSAKEIILSKENMPKNINNIGLTDKKNQLVLQEMNSDLLTIKKTYLFDLQTRILTTTNNTVSGYKLDNGYWKSLNFGDWFKQTTLPKGYTLNIEALQ